jgi:hypothetical protein
MGMKEVVETVAFFIAVLGPLGIGLLVPARYLAALLSAAWPVMIGVIVAISYGMPKESGGTWLLNIVIISGMAAVYGLIVFYVKTKWKTRRNKAI